MEFKLNFIDRLQALAHRDTYEFPREILPGKLKTAAVLLPFWPTDSGNIEVVLTKRPESMRDHPGQVSFPGGRMHDEDETIAATALRETHEELGIDPDDVSIMGRLDDAWSLHGLHVIPYVGWLEKKPEITPDAREVAEVLIADVETLMHPDSSCEHTVDRKGLLRITQAYKWQGGYVWGLTADFLLELFLWIRDEPSNRGHLRQNYMEEMQKKVGS